MRSKMNIHFFLPLAQKLLLSFWESEEVKTFVISLLEKYAKSSDNDIDDVLVNIVRSKLFNR